MEEQPKSRKRKASNKSDDSTIKLLKADEDLFEGTGNNSIRHKTYLSNSVNMYRRMLNKPI